MALDGIFLSCLKEEIAKNAVLGRVDKIYQPSQEELVFSIRTREKKLKLLFSARASSPRVHFTNQVIDNPQNPPMLCMLFRKKLCGAKLIAVRQPDLERALFFDFEATNELGDKTQLTLVIEIMGKYSNIILIDKDLKIIDAVKRVSRDMSSKRQIFPGIKYELPPGQNKLNILNSSVNDIVKLLLNRQESTLNSAFLSVIQGISPIVCRELEYRSLGKNNVLISSLNEEDIKNIEKVLISLKKDLEVFNFSPVLVLNEKTPKDFSFFPINFDFSLKSVTFSNFSLLLDDFYKEKDRLDRVKNRGSDLLKLLNNYISRIENKIKTQEVEIRECHEKEILRIYGDLIMANLYCIKKGDSFANIKNFYDENQSEVKIRLDQNLTASQNAQKYYKDYRKANTAQKVLALEIEKGKKELDYLETVLDSVIRSNSELEINLIKKELEDQGYIKIKRKNKKLSHLKECQFLCFTSDDGFKILIGRNNIQNDNLTLKQSKKEDIWMHVKDAPGSHVVIVSEGRNIPTTTLIQAANLAAFHSKNKNSSNVAVDYTYIKNVKKPQGAKPGKVIYDNFRTLFVTPDINLIDNLTNK